MFVSSAVWGEDSSAQFQIYLPSRTTSELLVVEASVTDSDGLELSLASRTDLGIAGASLVSHPDLPILYISDPKGGGAATVQLDSDGSPSAVQRQDLNNGYSYLSIDRDQRFLLGCNYGSGQVDIYRLSPEGQIGERTGSLSEGKRAAHCVLPTPDNRFLYIPYVKDSNALFGYAFNAETGVAEALPSRDMEVGDPSGPRHQAYHPKLPITYFSNEQRPGISTYKIAADGQLELLQIVDALSKDAPKDGVSSSDIAISPDGKFVFSGIRAPKLGTDAIASYRVGVDGTLTHLGNTPADSVPWGIALSPDGRFLLVTAFGGGTLTAFEIAEDGTLKVAAKLRVDPKISDVVTR